MISSKKPVLVIERTRTFQNDIAFQRLRHLISDCKLNPRDILCISYAKWGKNRISKNINNIFNGLELRHSDFTTVTEICKDILSEENVSTKSLSFFIQTVEELSEELDIVYSRKLTTILGRLAWIEKKNNRRWNQKEYFDVIASVFNNFKNGIELYSEEDIESLYLKLAEKIIDFRLWYKGDVIIKAITLLNDEKIKSKWQNRIKSVIYDRFNVVCPFKFEIIKKLCEVSRSVFCVGYPSTSNRENMKRKFLEYFPDGQVFS